MDKKCEIPEIKIPPGYTQINSEQMARYREKCPGPVDRCIRESLDHIHYVFDAKNPEYLKLLDQFKKDTKQLEQALRFELRKRNIPVWVPLWIPESHPEVTTYRKMSFLLRPPFFRSPYEQKSAENRWQKDDERDTFILHFDERKTLQVVRRWVYQSSILLIKVRNDIGDELTKDRDFFQKNYGNWEIIAEKIATILEACSLEIEVLRKWQKDPSQQFVQF